MYLVILFGLSTLVHLVQPRSIYSGQLFGRSTAMFLCVMTGTAVFYVFWHSISPSTLVPLVRLCSIPPCSSWYA